MNKDMQSLLRYYALRQISGPLLFLESVGNVGYGELVRVYAPNLEERIGQVIDVGEDVIVIQVFEGTADLNIQSTSVRFTGEAIKLSVSTDMLGRVFNGRGELVDHGPNIIPEDYLDIHGTPINPYARKYPSDFVQTGISVIDGMNALVQGQKLPIFSGTGLPHTLMASQIVRHAKVEAGDFIIVFAAIGITDDEATFLKEDFIEIGASNKVVMFLNLAEDPVLERILAPRMALTASEYLAFEHNMHVLTIISDMTNYCEALREISAARVEIPGRRGYPGYMYTDLASIYERAGKIKGRNGSITLIPILTMPDDDITHPIPDLTGFITEGQIILNRDLYSRGFYPPIEPLLSLSRLMDQGIGDGKTREDHKQLSDELYYAYAEGKAVREMAMISGEAGLTSIEKDYLRFLDRFEKEFINQGLTGDRNVTETLDLGWELLSILPESELSRIDMNVIKRFHPRHKHTGVDDGSG